MITEEKNDLSENNTVMKIVCVNIYYTEFFRNKINFQSVK